MGVNEHERLFNFTLRQNKVKYVNRQTIKDFPQTGMELDRVQ